MNSYKVYSRRVQYTGGSTYIISLPKEWVKRAKIKAGDELLMITKGNNSIILFRRESEEENLGEIKVNSRGVEELLRDVISYYLGGYEGVIIRGHMPKFRNEFKENVRKRLIGAEIIEEDFNKLVIKFFAVHKDLSLLKALNHMYNLTDSMIKDVLVALEQDDKGRAQDVIGRDEEVDRFYYLIMRQLKLGIINPQVAASLGLDKVENSLNYIMVAKSIERIADHATKIASHILEDYKRIENEVFMHLISIGKLAYSIFLSSYVSLKNLDVDFANSSIAKVNELYSMGVELLKSALAKKEPFTNVNLILESFTRIAEYSRDIAEISINMARVKGKVTP